MFLSIKHRKQLVLFYFLCFAVYYGWYWYHGILLHQLKPVFFLNRLDLTANIVLLTNLHHAIIDQPWLQILFDALYFILPLALYISCIRDYRIQYFLAVATAVFNLVYAVMLSALSPLSIEGFTGWMLLPLLFAFKRGSSFYYMFHSLRYFFLLIFFSAALWKFRAGGIFNEEQMSAILLKQHSAYLVGKPDDWFSSMIGYLVKHDKLSYLIYLLATLMEGVFIIGFFTRRYDRILILLFLTFVAFDYFLMRINYFSWTAFIGCLWYSRLTPDTGNTETL